MATYQFAKIKIPKDDGGTKKQPAKSSGSSGDFNSKHKRAAKGSSTGGQFVAMSYDSKRNVGTGYGSQQGDTGVRRVQEALRRLGVKDKNGKLLVVDGKYGPLTTSAVAAWQKAHGVKPADGRLTPALVQQLTRGKSPRKSSGKSSGKSRKLPARRKPLKGRKPAAKTPAKPAAKPPPPPRPKPWERAGKRPPSNYRPNASE